MKRQPLFRELHTESGKGKTNRIMDVLTVLILLFSFILFIYNITL